MRRRRERQKRKSNLDYALEYASKGWDVLPLHTVKDGKCSCKKPNCENIGKHPQYHKDSLAHGLSNASGDEGVIKQWWKLWPYANIGLRLNKNTIVIDEDPRSGGDKTRQELENRIGKFSTKALVQKTGGDGHHYLFCLENDYEIRSRDNVLGDGMDIKIGNAYIVAFPSVHQSGSTYSWLNGDIPNFNSIPPCPASLLKEIQEKYRSKSASGSADDTIKNGAKKGSRNSTCFELARKYRWLLDKGHITYAAVEAIILEFARNCQPPLPEAEALRTLESALSYTRDEATNTFSVQESGTTIYMVKDSQDVAAIECILREGEEVTTWIKDPSSLSSIHKKRLRNRVAVVLPPDDYDDIKTAEELAKAITKYARSARVTAPPPGKDVITLTDWIKLNFPEDDPQSYENVYPLFRKFFDRMVNEAIEMRHLPYVMNDFLRTFEEFREVPDFPQKKIVMSPWLQEFDYGFIYGPDGSGKTFLIWEIARGLTHGGPVMGGHWHVDEPMKVLIIDSELPPGDIQTRSQLMGIDKSHVISRQELIWRGVWPPLNLPDEMTQRLIYDTARKGKFGAVMIDNISSMTDGINPDKEEDWKPINNFFLSLRTLGAMVIYAGHVSKAGSPRGTIAKLDAVDWGLSIVARGKVDKHRGKGVGGEDPCEFSILLGKKRGIRPGLTGFTYRFEDGVWHVEEGIIRDEGKSAQEPTTLLRDCEIAKGLIEGLQGKQIAANVGVTAGAITHIKNKLLKAGVLKEVTVKGKSSLEAGPKMQDYFAGFYDVVFCDDST